MQHWGEVERHEVHGFTLFCQSNEFVLHLTHGRETWSVAGDDVVDER